MQHPHFSKTIGWIILGALLGLSPQLVGCDTNPKRSEAVSDASAGKGEVRIDDRLTKAPSTAKKDGAPVNDTAAGVEASETSEPATEAATAPVPSAPVPSTDLPRVKRLVIASSIENREPIEITEGKVEEPFLAFVELEHKGSQDAGLVVTFEHAEGTKVGFVELEVPAESPRYRTWARTRNIREPGTWTAVVKSKSGEELARKSFTVAG